MLRSAGNFFMPRDLTWSVNYVKDLTKQSEKDDADINVIVKRFGIGGVLPLVQMPPLNVEFGEVFDFQSAQNTILAAKASFNALPADLRAEFQNDAAKFVAFASDPQNIAELKKMGVRVTEEELKLYVKPDGSDVVVKEGDASA